jgi:acyl-homoserine-lactone acylase
MRVRPSPVLLTLLFLACATPEAQAPPAAPTVQVASEDLRGAGTLRYEATIRRTAYGVAHIEAAEIGSLGFGEGYAQAEDHLCSIADQVVRARGERARYLGRGDGDRHLLSDLAMRALRVPERAVVMLDAQPAEIRHWLDGFAAGYNRYLEVTGRDAVPGWCRGEDWVVPVSAADLVAYYRLLALTISSFAGPIATAQPPGPPATGTGGTPDAAGMAGADGAAGAAAAGSIGSISDRAMSEFPGPRQTASNGWALGRDLTESGRGMLLANPHYPWIGSNRLWEKHLVIPGDLEVYGVSLLGVPGVMVGFTEGVGWTHTVSAGTRYTLYAVDLVPGDPTRYRYGGEERAMTPLEVGVEVRGETEPARRTLWSTHHGPVMSTAQLQWTDQRAFALRDANEDNDGLLAHALAANRATSLADFQRAHADHQGLPWVNTMAVSPDGVAWYIDSANTPSLTADALAEWLRRRDADPLTRQLWQSGVVLLGGSDPRFEWRDDPEARHPGIVPFRELPQLERTDYVFNANDSFWLAHGDTVLEGRYSPLHGEQRVPVSLRTRNNILHLSNATPDRPAGADGRFSRQAVQHAILANRSLAADLLAPELVARCAATPRVEAGGQVVDLGGACAVLAAWDHRLDLDSRGAVLFREWLGQYTPADLRRSGALFAVDFDPADPVSTPRGLAAGELALENLAKAVEVLESRDLSLDVPLGELQYAPSKLPRRIPLHGGIGSYEGVLNLMQGTTGSTTLEPLRVPPRVQGSRFLTEAGYPVLHGTSFLMALEFTDDGPRAMAVLTYGQSGDPESEHFTDQTELFARKEWRPILFNAGEIAAETRRTYTVRSAGSPAGAVPR